MAEETLQMGRALAEAEALVDEQYELSSDYGLPFWITWSAATTRRAWRACRNR